MSVGGRDSGGKQGMAAHGPTWSTATPETAEEQGMYGFEWGGQRSR